MKIGDKVKCIEAFGLSSLYLTNGKIYEVHKESTPFADNGFFILSDRGDLVFGLLHGCAHAKWEQVK